MDREESFEMR